MPSGLLYVYLLSLLPSVEGRYAVLAGRALGVSLWAALLASALGVATLSLVLPRVLYLIDTLVDWMAASGWRSLGRMASLYKRYVERARRRAAPYIERYGLPGLVVFVAIPLPATGVWTGALAAYLLGVEKGRATAALLLGGLLSIAFMLVPAYLAAGLGPASGAHGPCHPLGELSDAGV